ncbi:Protein CBG26684 [Caenorhabditis briggsae]|uniref:Protein CBG26684 n=1 Tax=Caenorhabditis briggsae TaxID=6238 RepID=B6IE55_CAEBR|nr:Protein CBG26684 [Caenorhabditis briggsae]CAS01119.1 Protein CBG26684 [Caenorhabditis briggsae]
MGMKELAGSIQAFDREIERLRQLESELSTPRKPVPKKKIQEEIERWNCKNDGFVTNISFYDNNSQEFLRGNATLREQYEKWVTHFEEGFSEKWNFS